MHNIPFFFAFLFPALFIFLIFRFGIRFFNELFNNSSRLNARDRWQLYDMANDPSQQLDVAAEHPDTAARLAAAYDRWFADVTHTPIVRPPIPVGYRERPTVNLPAPEAYFTGAIRWYNQWGFAHDWLTGWSDANDSIWWDEGYSVWMARLPVGQMFFETAHDAHPPLSYLLLGGWRGLVGDEEFALRTLSVFCGLLTVAIAYQIGRTAGGVEAGMIGALLAGWDEIVGVEMNAEYVEIAKARLTHWAAQGRQERML